MLRLQQTDDGDLQLPIVLVDGVESVKSALYNLFSTQAQDQRETTGDGVVEIIQGEWPFDKSHGLRWRGVVLRKFFSPDETRAIIAATANRVPEVEEVTSSQVTLTIDSVNRQVNITLQNVRLTSGETISEISITVAS